MRRFVTAVLLITLLTVSGLVGAGQVAAQDYCDSSAIMRSRIEGCGARDPEAMVNLINHSQQKDLPAIFAKYGLSRADYAKFGADNKMGKMYKDGTIKVDGKTVGRSTLNLSRTKTSTFTKKVVINGQTYWGGSFGSTYHADTADVLVLMKNGQLKFAAIASCGNPQQLAPPPATPPTPQPEPTPQPTCDRLKKTKLSKDRYQFTASADLDGAEFVKAVYDFGDGSKNITTSRLKQSVEHSFSKSSKVRVTVYYLNKNDKSKPLTSSSCTQNVTVNDKPVPPEEPVSNAYCSAFKQPELIDSDARLYKFTVVANTTNARFIGANFYFSDAPDAAIPVAPNGDNQAIVNHAFPSEGDYTVRATLSFEGTDGKTFTGDCVSSVTIDETTPPEDCVSDGKEDCEQPELTDAGAGTIALGIFGGTGTLAAVGHYIVRRRLGL